MSDTNQGAVMTRKQRHDAMDIAQVRLVKGDDPENVAVTLQETFGWDWDTSLDLAIETSNHPITKILVKAAR